MSTIAQNLEALQQAKSDIAEAITTKGGTVNSGDGFADFATDIGTIPTGAQVTLEDKTVSLDMASGNQEVSPSSGYDALSKVTVTKPATLIPENIKKDENVGGVVGTFAGTPIPNNLDGLVDGSITAFIMPAGKTTIKASLFDGLTGLLTADLTGATVIQDFAFRNCSNAAITLPSGLTSVGQYAFYNAGTTSSPMQLLATGANCSVLQYAFQRAKITKVQGTFGSVETYAFNGCTLLAEVDITCTGVGENAFSGSSTPFVKLHAAINGAIGNYAFSNAFYISDLSISGRITSLGSYAFQALGAQRTTPAQNILTIDLRNSTITTVGANCFYGSNATNGLKYMQIYLPSTCSSLGSQAFYYLQNSDIFYTRATAPTIQSNTFANATNIRHFVPYGSVTAYRTATNWTTQAAVIYGWAPGNTFSQGDTLPTMTADYYGITWYSDKAMTQQVTTVTDPTAPLYCSVGTTKVYYVVGAITALDCTVTISDGTNTYTTGDLVATGASLTISTTGTDPTKPAVYMLDINGTDYAPASSETITVAGDISIMAIYWDEVNPPIAILNNLDWATIQSVCAAGNVPSGWLGQTKTDSNGIDWMCVDTKAGRYAKVNGGYTNAVFMMVPILSSLTQYSSSTANNYPNSYLRSKMQSGGVYFNQIDTTLSALVDANQITVYSSNYNNSSTNAAIVSFYAPCHTELGFSGTYNFATSAETICNGTTYGAYEYFASAENSKRIKYLPNSQGPTSWHTRSRYDWTNAVNVTASGGRGAVNTGSSIAAVACFAF